MSFLASIFRPPLYQDAGTFSSPGGWLMRAVGGKSNAGVTVSEFSSLRLPVVYACVNRIGNPVAWFPLRMYRTRQSGGKEVVLPGTGPGRHPFASRIGVRPNDLMSSRTVRKTTQAHALLWGNGYQEIERNGRGQSVGLYPLLPDRTAPVKERGEHFFRTTIDGRQHRIDPDNVIHIMDQSQDGYVGMSQIALAREAVAMGLAMETFGGKFFANDAKSGGFLLHPGKLSGQAKQNIKGPHGEHRSPESPAAGLEAQGGLDNAHRVKVLEEGMKFVQTMIPPEDAQFLGSREFQIAEIARIFDVPLVLLQSHEKSTSWGSGIEQLMIGFIRQTVGPWVDTWEQELNWKLFTEEEKEQGYYVKFNMNALLRGDMKTRAAFYQTMFGVAAFSPNRILQLEDEDPIGPEGDEYFVPANMVTRHRSEPSAERLAAACRRSGARSGRGRSRRPRREGRRMKYAHILLAFASEFWAIDPDKMDQMVSFLALQAAGEKFSAEELQARISKQQEREVARQEGAVTVLPLRGVIANRINLMSEISGGASSEGFGRQFDAAIADPQVKAVIIDTDSPGGIVTGTDELSSKIHAARGSKPIVAHVNGIAASAAYWIATAADEMVMTRSSEVGSIGVIGVHDDVSAALEKLGVKKTLISAGKFKAEGHPFGPLSEEALAHRQERVASYYDDFVRAVARNRNASLTAVREGFGQGRMVRAEAAIAEGMADSIATLDETIARFNSPPAPKRKLAAERERRALAL